MLREDLKNGAVCTLGIFVDHTYYWQIARGSSSVAVSKVAQHVAEADFVFRMTDMDLDALPDNIGFQISPYITVYQSANHHMSDTSLDAVDFMDRFSRHNFDAFCVAIAFTCRDFGEQIVVFVTVISNISLLLWPPYGIGQAIIFLLCGFFCLSFFSRLISAAANWMSAILRHMM